MSIIRPILNVDFNIAVLTIANRLCPQGWDVSDIAPHTLEGITGYIQRVGRPCVWRGGSERTIFGEPETNYAFRAWHDVRHWQSGATFDAEGEAIVCMLQQADIRKLFGPHPEFEALLHAEVLGQLRHQEVHGAFPDDQYGFVREYLVNPTLALARRW